MLRRSSGYGTKSFQPQAIAPVPPIQMASSGAAALSGGKDPRPIRDKNFQMEIIRQLISFLAKAGYPHPISQKILTAPSAKDFQQIFRFLYGQLDPGYDFGLGGRKFEEEVPVLMKGLRYPFAGDISKSQLVAVGSMHAWPGLLAMLGWMVELISCCDELQASALGASASAMGGDEEMDGGASMAASAERIFFDYLKKTYKAFLAGSDNFDPMIAELGSSFERGHEATYQEVARLEEAVAELEATYQALVGEEVSFLMPIYFCRPRSQKLSGNFPFTMAIWRSFIASSDICKPKRANSVKPLLSCRMT